MTTTATRRKTGPRKDFTLEDLRDFIEDRPGADRRYFGGRYRHTLRRKGESLEIVMKRVDITNCDQSFPALTQPF